jgi:hypothetical protein
VEFGVAAAALEDVFSNWDRLVFMINRQVLS